MNILSKKTISLLFITIVLIPSIFSQKSVQKQPESKASFKSTIFHFPPVSQGISGTCWAFGAISFAESEIKRISGKEIKLSEIFLVYWEYVERAMQFVEERGETYFAEGSESNAIKRWLDKYGLVPEYAYTGLINGKVIHNHQEMAEKMEDYLKTVKNNNAWNKEEVRKNIISILNKYLGAPPDSFIFEGKMINPLEFRNKVLPIRAKDWVSFISVSDKPYNQKAVLDERDNWWHSDDYYNVTLDDFYNTLKTSVSKGYSVCICGDVSEPNWNRKTQAATIPVYDIPWEYIDTDARQMRWKDESTTDDHCMHAIGMMEMDGKTWFLLKDSGGSFAYEKDKGYHFVREDYIKLKMVNIMLHKDAAKVLNNIIK